MDGRQAIVVGEMKDHNMEDQWSMTCLDLVLRSEVKGYAVFPLFELFVQFADSVQQSTVGLF